MSNGSGSVVAIYRYPVKGLSAEKRDQVVLAPLRFRANIYFDGLSAWSEHDWIDSEIAIGPARLRVISPITRCAATQVNPATAERDLDIVAALVDSFDHTNMGVYAEVVAGGEIAVGDPLLKASGT